MYSEKIKHLFFIKQSLAIILIASSAFADDVPQTESAKSNDNQKVIYEYPDSPDADYRGTRDSVSYTFEIGKRDFLPADFRSAYDQNSYGSTYAQSAIPAYSISFGVKRNYSPVSIELVSQYSIGEIKDTHSLELPSKSNKIRKVSRSLSVNKLGFGLNLFYDGYTDNPIFIPHIGFKVISAEITEKISYEKLSNESDDDPTWKEFRDQAKSKDSTFSSGSELQLGLLVSLHPLEPDAARVSKRENGIKLMALDLYTEKTSTSKLSSGPDLTTGWDFGFGLRFEF